MPIQLTISLGIVDSIFDFDRRMSQVSLDS